MLLWRRHLSKKHHNSHWDQKIWLRNLNVITQSLAFLLKNPVNVEILDTVNLTTKSGCFWMISTRNSVSQGWVHENGARAGWIAWAILCFDLNQILSLTDTQRGDSVECVEVFKDSYLMYVIGIQVCLNEMGSNCKYMLNHTATTSEHSNKNTLGKFPVFVGPISFPPKLGD